MSFAGTDCRVFTVALDAGDASDERTSTHHAFLLTFANGRQWGNGALIAPLAELDDGALDAVVVEDRGRGAVLRAIPRLFTGAPGRRARGGDQPIRVGEGDRRRASSGYHADGEPISAGSSLVVSVRPGALRLRS